MYNFDKDNMKFIERQLKMRDPIHFSNHIPNNIPKKNQMSKSLSDSKL
jgi:hypothetical protein